jgi:hypothetical protein
MSPKRIAAASQHADGGLRPLQVHAGCGSTETVRGCMYVHVGNEPTVRMSSKMSGQLSPSKYGISVSAGFGYTSPMFLYPWMAGGSQICECVKMSAYHFRSRMIDISFWSSGLKGKM